MPFLPPQKLSNFWSKRSISRIAKDPLNTPETQALTIEKTPYKQNSLQLLSEMVNQEKSKYVLRKEGSMYRNLVFHMQLRSRTGDN